MYHSCCRTTTAFLLLCNEETKSLVCKGYTNSDVENIPSFWRCHSTKQLHCCRIMLVPSQDYSSICSRPSCNFHQFMCSSTSPWYSREGKVWPSNVSYFCLHTKVVSTSANKLFCSFFALVMHWRFRNFGSFMCLVPFTQIIYQKIVWRTPK